MGSQVVLATAGYDHTIRFWEATSGICYRTLQYADSQVSFLLFLASTPAAKKKLFASILFLFVRSLSFSPFPKNKHDDQVNKLEITADKQLLAAGGNPHVSGN